MRILLIVLLLMGVGAFFYLDLGAQPVVKQKAEVASISDKKASYLALKVNMERGAQITAKDLQWRELALDDGEVELSGYLVQAAVDVEKIHGAVLLQSVQQGELLSRYDIAKAGEAGYLSAVIRPGMRAVSIVIDKVSGSAGLILPGNFVDVIMTTSEGGDEELGTDGLLVKTILSGARVLAINDHVDSLASDEADHVDLLKERSGTATLEVSGQQAQELTLASRVGQLTLSLRGIRSPSAHEAEVEASHSNAMTISKDYSQVNLPPSMVLMHGVSRRDLSAKDKKSERIGE